MKKEKKATVARDRKAHIFLTRNGVEVLCSDMELMDAVYEILERNPELEVGERLQKGVVLSLPNFKRNKKNGKIIWEALFGRLKKKHD